MTIIFFIAVKFIKFQQYNQKKCRKLLKSCYYDQLQRFINFKYNSIILKFVYNYKQKKNYYNLICWSKRQKSSLVFMIEKELQQVKIQPKLYKKSLCRFYLRGLCIYEPQQCSFSHGIKDLDYQCWNGQQIEYDFQKQTQFNQKSPIKGPKVYKNLFEYQTEKIFTLEELNEDREKRKMIRNAMHQQLYRQFIQLLEIKHPEANFSQDFLVREYNRVGFNKLMTLIHFSFLCKFLCQQYDSVYFKQSFVMPPYVKTQRTFLTKKASDEEIHQHYRKIYQNLMSKHEKGADEGLIKKAMYNQARPSLSIPPISVYLKNRKQSLSQFLQLISPNLQPKVVFEQDDKTLLQTAINYLSEQKYLRSWSDVLNHISKQHKINNAGSINKIKPMLIQSGYLILNFPMFGFIIHRKELLEFKEQQQLIELECTCPFREKYTDEQLNKDHLDKEEKEPIDEAFQINDLQSLKKYSNQLLQSKVLSVDLEGRLRSKKKHGRIQLIQLNNGRHTFLIDIHLIQNVNKDQQTFNWIKKVLRNIMVDRNILKIFHDSRHDSLALHEFINSCIINVFDTSAIQTYHHQILTYQQKIKPKDLLAKVANVRTPGLNQILEKYQAPHGINKNKDLFHKMWAKGEVKMFDERPLNKDYKEYCIKDVLDLPYLQKVMSKGISPTIAQIISSQYVKYGYQSTLDNSEEQKGKDHQ